MLVYPEEWEEQGWKGGVGWQRRKKHRPQKVRKLHCKNIKNQPNTKPNKQKAQKTPHHLMTLQGQASPVTPQRSPSSAPEAHVAQHCPASTGTSTKHSLCTHNSSAAAWVVWMQVRVIHVYKLPEQYLWQGSLYWRLDRVTFSISYGLTPESICFTTNTPSRLFNPCSSQGAIQVPGFLLQSA